MNLDFMRRLRATGVSIWLEGDAVRFSAPRGVLSAELLAILRSNKDAIREFLRRIPTDAEPRVPAPPITKAPREGELPLSFAQRRLWFLDRLEPDSAFYNIPAAVRLSGPLDVSALEQSLQEIVRRHEALRTTFPTTEGQARQEIVSALRLLLPVVEVQEADVRRRAEEEAQKPFDLARGPLLRTTLLRLREQEHVLLLTMHHIVSDGWSLGVLVRELGALYEAFSTGRPSPLPELPFQYADYAAWQRKWLSGEVLEAQLAYWKKQLGGAPPALELPTDRPRPPVQTYRGAVLPVALSRELSAGLAALSRREGVTLFMTLLAAFQVLLQRYTGQDDIVVGSPIAGRTQVETEALIGFFVQTLALRTDLSGEPTVRELLGRAREVTLGAYAHQDVPFEKLVEELSPVRDLSRSPLFQVMLVLQNAPLPALSLGEVKLGVVEVEHTTAKFELTLSLGETEEGLRGALEYSTDLFDAVTVERMVGHFRALLEGMVAEPGRRVSELPLLTVAERQQLLVAWNDTAAEYPRDRCIHELFEAQVEKTPEAVAVVFEEHHLTYRELNVRANQLGHHLRSLGVEPEVLVGLCVERSLEMVVGLLGILKAGGAYVPLDPTYPEERLAFMLEDARISVVVTQQRLAGNLPVTARTVLCLDTDWQPIASERTDNSGSGAEPANVAYVVYTSGSTGKPKGVCVVHRSVVRLVKDVSYARLASDEVFLQLAPLAFDASTFELWAPLLNGGRLVVFPVEKPSLEMLEEVVRVNGVTTLWLTAGLFNATIDARPQGLAPLRQLLVGGEALSVPHVQKAQRELPAVRLINGYGPTEGTTFTCCFPITSADTPSIPIGRPISNTQVYVLDCHQQPVPVGVPGELYIGGAGVARGYLNRPELTAERFLQDPFRDEPGARLYKTGDLCRWRPDGNLEYLGRIDHQVKLRGFRIELGEVESVLGQHPAVREAVVLAREDVPEDKRLVAYLVARKTPLPGVSELRSYLQSKLPEYMVPAAFVELPALPLTPNGKVDRRALPAPDLARPDQESAFVAPRTPVEEVLAGIWAEVLRVERVSVFDNFFELGGHSLLATQVLGRLRPACGVDVPLRALFNAPTVAGLAVHLEAALRSGALPAAPPLVVVPREGELPLSFAQQRLWFLDRLQPESAFYNIPAAVRLSGPLDVSALEQSLQEIVRRHEALRTTFPTTEGQARQEIAREIGLLLPVVEVPEAEVRRRVADEARKPFDLARGPLLRTTLLQLREQEHVLLLTMHHIVSDGWSLGVLVRELGALYEAFSTGHPPPLPELPLQYADYAAWQRQWLSGEVLEAQLAYWKRQLGGAPPVLELPTDRPRPPVQTYRGAALPVALSRELSAGLAALSRREGVTLFMTLLAAFQVLLQRYTGQGDIVVGSPIAGRTQVETEALIGFFIQTLVLRTDLSGEPTVRELLGRAREVTLGAYVHQDVPFEKLVEELSPVRDLSRSPLFQVMLVLQNAPLPALSLGEVKLGVVEVEHTTAKFELTLSLGETEEGLRGALEYSTDLFEAATIERMVGHYQVLLEGMVAEPGGRVSALPLLTAAERHQLLVAWNDTAAEYPRDRCIHELFEAQVEKTPDAVAVIFEEQQLTYRELNARANQLGHHLRSLGVGPEVLAGLCVERSLEMVVGLLGILKAGGAYVPLDPTYPKERLAFTLEDAGVPVLLTQERFLPQLPDHLARILCLDTQWADVAGESEALLEHGTTPENVAYVIYTSGSTGKSKGVQVSHGNVVRLFAATEDWFHFDASDVWTLFHSYAFDFSVWEIWGALLHGGRLVVVPFEVSRSPEAFHSLLCREGVTVLNQTPSAFRSLVAADATAAEDLGRSLRWVVFGGEAVDLQSLRPWFQRHGDRQPQLVNMYGITETTVHVTYRPLCSSDLDGDSSSPIGQPIPDLRVYILDAHRQPVPIGVPGELYVGGAGVARGYLNRPELTAERFLQDPFCDEPGARLYKTGDLGRWRPDGNLEYLGRIDNQVKIRGFRIELGEIESVLGQHPSVREAVVLAREDAPGDKRLVAYLVAREAPLPGVSELRSYLQSKLPEYMVPAAFMELSALPLTPNGKIDRRALPAPDLARPQRESAFVAPQTPVEEVLAGIWAQVLRVERVSVCDNFFELGGHSLLATQVLGRLRSVFGVDVPLRALFNAPTVAGLAVHLQAALRAGALPATPPLVALPREGELPLSFAQQRLWFLDRLEPESAFYNIPAAVRLSGPLDVSALEQSLQEIVRRHEALRTTFPTTEGQARQEIARELGLLLPVVEVQEADLRQQAKDEARKPFDLARGPLLRTTLLRLSEREHVLLLTIHHIVSDGWSLGVLVRELGALYKAFSTGRPSPLPELPLQYADYAAWQRQWLSGDVLEAQLAYWKRQLGSAPPVLELPTDRPRPPVQTYRGAVLPVALSRELSAGLAALSRREGVTLFMTLLAAFQVLLQRYTGQDDIVVGSPIAGRTQVETEGLIGFFVNTLVLRTDLSGEPTVGELFGRVREVTLGAYAHQEVPFEKLVEELSPVRDQSRSPLFQVMLVLQNAPLPALSLGEVKLGLVEVEHTTAKFELTLSLRETEQGLQGALEYNTDLFNAATIQQMVGHFGVLLKGMVAEPDQRVSELPLLTAAERHRLLVAWNETAAEYAQDRCIHELFETQVEKTPDAVAVTFEEQQLTYRELNAQANQLGHHLRSLGVGPEVLVGLCVERSVEMAVGLLGILKAGGAYVPLDPTHPKERLAFMLEDTGAPVLLTQQRLLTTLSEHRARVLCLDTDWEPVSREGVDNPASGARPDNLAYVIYTSGSTGKPKGALIEHRGVCNLTQAQGRAFGVQEGSHILQFASFGFDAAVSEFFMGLTAGGTLCLAPRDALLPASNLACLLREQAINVVTLPPTLAAVLPDEQLPALHSLIVAGEPCSADLVTRWANGRRFFNAYGPTEATVCATFHECFADGGRPPIGRPMANVRVYVLGPRLQPMPVGVPGELYIGGPGVARGYLNRPELTAERFLQDPFRDEPGARLYKTGDICRWRPDGTLEYLGRIDHQVKLRGFRIELGEIESVLGQHPSAREAVVLAREDAPGDKRLVAYLVAREAALLRISELRSYLQSKLPEYMVPAAFVELSALPLTPNGKVDRRALPAPDLARPDQESAFGTPRTPVEEVLAGIWAEVLRVERVGVFDNFFELGGHSLLATQVLGRLRPVFGAEVPLRALFNAPTVTGLAVHLEAALRAGALPAAPPLVAASREGELPLSFAQQRLWFLDRLEPESAFYNIPAAMRLSGPLDVSALEQSLQEIVRRHEALRTTFPTTEGRARQEIARKLELLLRIVEVQKADVRRRAEEEARKPFDLARGPLLRTTLLRLGEQEHVLLLTMHHIVSDGWSLGVLVQEFGALYAAFSTGRPSPLPKLPLQYADYAVWQRQWFSGEVLEAQVAYWKQQLGGAPPALDLPTDRPRPPVQTYRGAALPVALSRELSAGLAALSRREGVTLFMTLLAAFQVLLQRYTGQDDIVVGSPIAGRTQVETEALIGFFVQTLALRTDLSGQPTVRELLGRAREVTLGAYAHQDVPFEKLVEELSPVRDLSRSPLFQVMLVLQNAPLQALSLGEVKLGVVEVEHTTAKFELTLSLGETEEGLRGALEYSTDLFDAATVERMLGHFRVLLDGMVAEPGQRVSELPLLTAAERHQLLVAWNDTAAEYPRDRCIHELFEAQMEKTPEAVAVVFEDQRLTYRELNARANQLGHHLQSLGVGPEVPVGLSVERSLEMVVGLLGILKAGGAYVPLDPTYPEERLAFMLEDTGTPVLLTQQRLLTTLPEHRARVLCLDTDWEPVAREGVDNPASGARPDNLAYVIYTSGSTGRPKGVAMPHGCLVNLIAWQVAASPGARRTLQLASVSFDVCFQEVFTTWLSGGVLFLIDEESRRDPQRLLARLDDWRIERLFVPPVALQQLAESVGAVARAPANVREIISAGEALRVTPAIKSLCAALPGAVLRNQYGPSETHVVSERALAGDPAEWPLLPSIGGPIANAHVYVLDRRLAPVPVGVPGELYIGGAGVARGYLNRPELTAERFLQDPFSNQPGARLYKTGDICRWRPDGELEFLGRIDHQVKIRGFRIEPGEIESVLGQHPSVHEAVVLAREDVPGDKRLVAYLMAREEPLPGVSELRSYLQNKLPEYMVPAAFVELSALPLTPNGKVDRRALPAPDLAHPERESAFVAPRTPVEEVLAVIWAEVLRVQRVGVFDNFFELGGHSLLATQVLGRLRPAFGVEVPLRALFNAPTVAGLAVHLEAALRVGALSAAPPLVAMPREGELPLSFAQQRMWFLDRLEPDSAFYNIPAGIRVSGPLDVSALEQSLQEIVRRHEALRTTFPTTEGQARQEIASELGLRLPVVEVQEAEVRRRAEEEAQKPFDLARGPLLSTTLLRLGEQEHVLLLTMHHIVSDGWSLGVLVRELGALYEAFSTGRPSPLPELPLQYADYAAWQRQWLSGEVLEAQLAYWKKQLGSAPPALELPTDRLRPPVQTYRGAALPVALSRELSAGLAALSRREGVTLFMTLLAAFQVLLARYTGQDDIVVGSPIAGRTQVETEGLIGFFVNTLVLRTDLSGEPTVRELLGRVREVMLGAYAHQEVPFEKLVEELSPARGLSRSPLFQVMLMLQNAPLPALSLGEVKLGFVEVEHTTAKFELTLSLGETEEGLRGALEYSTDLFDTATIQRMLGHYEVLLESMVAESGRRVSEISLLTAAERHQLLVAWNDTGAEYPRNRCIHELFEMQVEKTPGAVAVVFEEQQLTYRELHERSNQLAHHLRSLGVGPEVLVGLCVERSLEMVVGLLGILKAGGAYVPLDPTYPEERLAFMLEDTSAPVLLTQQRLLATLPERRARVLCLDTEWELIARERTDDLANGAGPDNLAYVIYTSGSTGKSKGVLGTHQSAVNRFAWMWGIYPFQPGEVCCQKTTLSFVDAIWEIFGPLLRGVPTVLVPEAVVRDVSRLVRVLADGHVTRLVLVPSLLRAMLDLYPDLGSRLPDLTHWTSSGEALPEELYARFSQGMPGRVLLNLYGSSEVAADATFFETTTGAAAGRMAIGRPIANTQVYMLDAHLQVVPVGVPGELYIGGAGVARGYLNRPELTAEKFLQNPFRNEPGARLYKTGDLGRWWPDGNLEYLGRIDHQVKLRGFRIELGEIESVLGQHPSVREAVVLAREDVPGNKRLVAYLVAREAGLPEVSELRTYLQGKLPEYMVPAAFVELSALPLTPSGKVDRRALPAPDLARPDPKSTFVAPRTTVEKTLAEIWAEVLQTHPIGLHDDFFTLGGHSLLAVRLMAAIESHMGRRLPLAHVFSARTVALQAAELVTMAGSTGESPLVAIRRTGARRPFFCVHPAGGAVLCYEPLSRALGPDQPFYGLQARAVAPGEEAQETVEAMAERYLEAMRKVQPEGPYQLGGWSFGGLVAFEIARRLTAEGQEIGALVLLDTPLPGGVRPTESEIAVNCAVEISKGLGLSLTEEDLHSLTVASILAKIGEVVEEAGLMPRGHGGLAIRGYFSVFLAAVLASNRYVPGPLPGALTLLRARDAGVAPAAHFNPSGGALDVALYAGAAAVAPAPDFDWGRWCARPITVHTVPGTHQSMVHPPHTEALARLILEVLDTAGGASR